MVLWHCCLATGAAPDVVTKLLEKYTNNKITDHALARWLGEAKQPGTTVFLLGLRTGREQGWGWDFGDGHDAKVDHVHDDGRIVPFDQHPIGRKIGSVPSTDWSLRDFLAVMFLREGACAC